MTLLYLVPDIKRLSAPTYPVECGRGVVMHDDEVKSTAGSPAVLRGVVMPRHGALEGVHRQQLHRFRLCADGLRLVTRT